MVRDQLLPTMAASAVRSVKGLSFLRFILEVWHLHASGYILDNHRSTTVNRTAAFRVPGPRTRQVEPGEGSPVRADRGRASNDRGRRAGPLKSRPKNPVDPEKRRAPSRLFRVLLQYWLGPPLILTTSRLFCRPPPRAYARAPPPRCGRLQARRRTDLLTTISPLAIDLRGPFAARLDARALRRRCARTPKSGQLVPAARIDGAECARACCAGADADAARRAAQPAPNVEPRPAA